MPGTCIWVLNDPKYHKWRSSFESHLLWISADPGCGKSVLAKFLIDNDLPTAGTYTICYFFFKDNENQNELSTALCAVLHQLFRSQPHLLRHARKAWEENGNALVREEDELWRILLSASSDPEAPDVILVLDAIDECKREDRKRLIKKLSQFYENTQSNISQGVKLKFLITSRPYDDIQQGFSRIPSWLPEIRLRGEEETDQIRNEIELVIEHQVELLSRDLTLNPEIMARIKQRLLGMEHRTYLWLYLAMEYIRDTYHDCLKPATEVIDSLPSTVDEAYEQILSKVAPKHGERVKQILGIVVGARRPLTVVEMALALDLDSSDPKTSADLTIDKDHVRRNIRQWCGLFVSVYNSEIHLIHQTAKEFLLRQSHPMASNQFHWKSCLNNINIDLIMARICITCLTLEDVRGHIIRFSQQFRREDKYSRRIWQDLGGLVEYSAEHWPSHLRGAHVAPNDQLISKILALYDTRGENLGLCLHLFGAELRHSDVPFDGMSSIELAAFNGHDVVLQLLLANEKPDLGSNNQGDKALILASELGHENIVRILLDRGVDVNAAELGNDSALVSASSRGHEKIVRQLLANGANVNAKHGRGFSPLFAAAHGGYEQIVQILLDSGADVNGKGGHCESPLQIAVTFGREQIVRLLLDNGANWEDNVVSKAAIYGYTKILQLLLENGPSVVDLESGLIIAVGRGSETMIRILLNKGPTVAELGSALQTAAREGHESIVRLLLNKGVEAVNIGRALEAAALGHQEHIFQLLLDFGAGQDDHELQEASLQGNEQIGRLLRARVRGRKRRRQLSDDAVHSLEMIAKRRERR